MRPFPEAFLVCHQGTKPPRVFDRSRSEAYYFLPVLYGFLILLCVKPFLEPFLVRDLFLARTPVFFDSHVAIRLVLFKFICFYLSSYEKTTLFDPEKDAYPYPEEAIHMTYDGLHPSDAGYEIIARKLEREWRLK